MPLTSLLPAAHDRVPVYGSGGFCSYSLDRLREQLGGWVEQGIPRVKMKLGREPRRDPARLDAARDAIGDAPSCTSTRTAPSAPRRRCAGRGATSSEWDVTLVRGARVVGGLRTGCASCASTRRSTSPRVSTPTSPRTSATSIGCVDCLQADVTRCGGITGLLRVNGLASAHGLDVSAHCAPQLSAHAFCGVDRLRHLEYFHDHVRVEAMLFDGVLEPVDGVLVPDRSRPGHGLELKRADAQRWAA